jgi:methylenetetrahydrofolate reductase (NADPH)
MSEDSPHPGNAHRAARPKDTEDAMRITDAIRENKPFLSLEFFPPKEAAKVDAFFETVERLRPVKPLFASVTCGAGGSDKSGTVEISARLKRECGIEPMPHFTCIGAEEASIEAFLDQLGEHGIENVLALRGDLPAGSAPEDVLGGRFRHASDLVSFIRGKKQGVSVGAACYPNAHPESPTIRDDFAATRFKVEQGAGFLVTQVVFDNRVYFDFVERLREMGVTVPVIPGVLPIQSLSSLRFILSRCNVSFPGSLIDKLEKAEAEGGPEAVREAALNHAIRQARDLLDGGAPGAHLYTLNKADMCLRIAQELGFGQA